MTVGTNTNNEEIIRKEFKKMNQLKEKYNLELLSMGMSNNYKIALEENTDIIRIGTKIFGERIYHE